MRIPQALAGPEPFPIPRKPLRILMRNRPDAFRNRGGDTVLMESLGAELRALGHTVDFDPDPAQPASSGGYDLLHLFNLTLPGILGPQAREARSQGIPFVIHALQEDWPRFLNKSLAAAIVLEKYVATGQRRSHLAPTLALLRESPVAEMPLCPEALHASAILCTGQEERNLIQRLYPGVPAPITLLGADASGGAELGSGGEGAEFQRAFGLGDFVFCVGRLEPRKNQLMLLAALEEDDIDIVFADGGFTYAPEYAAACRKFSRRGRTVFTGKLPRPMLIAGYRAARVSCLPSWYELPGLATLEAARHSPQVVSCDWGTLKDYLGSLCHYAEPDDFEGIRREILVSWNRARHPALGERASRLTWSNTAREVERIYRQALGTSLDNRHA